MHFFRVPRWRYGIALILVCLVAAHAHGAAAITSTFQIKASVFGADTTPPSQPADLNATVISTSQINLDWTASTDDFNVVGYQVFRDDVQIATSTNTSYIDTGLTAGTTYTYTVTAFDATPNISPASDQVVAKTHNLPVPTASSTGGAVPGHRGLEQLMLEQVAVEPGTNRLDITLLTNHPTVARLAWGSTSSYEQGTISGVAYQTSHQFTLSALDAATTYYLKIELIDLQGQVVTVERSVQTLIGTDTVPPANVTDLSAVATNRGINLHWNNPVTRDFAGVRVIRLDDGFTPSPYGGLVVYQDTGTGFTDPTVVSGHWYYYSVFSYDSAGNYASGALVRVAYNTTNIPVAIPISTTTSSTIPASSVNLKLITGTLTADASTTPWAVPADEAFELRALAGRLPTATFGVVIIHDADGGVTMYFLQPQADGTFGTDMIGIATPGAYTVEVQWYDRKQKLIGRMWQLLTIQVAPISLWAQLQGLWLQFWGVIISWLVHLWQWVVWIYGLFVVKK